MRLNLKLISNKDYKTIIPKKQQLCTQMYKQDSPLLLWYFKRLSVVSGQRCDCTEHDMPKDRTISRLRGEMHRLQEQMRKSEATKQPQKQAAKPSQPTIFVITPTYAR